MRSITILGALMLISATVIVLAADESDMKKLDVPEAVLNAFQKAYPNAEVTEYSKGVAGGQTLYEIEIKAGDLERDLIYLSDGTLLQIEEDVMVESLPDGVIKSIRKAHPESEIVEADMITRGETVQYEILLKAGETMYHLSLAADGTISTSARLGIDDDEAEGEDMDDEEDSD